MGWDSNYQLYFPPNRVYANPPKECFIRKRVKDIDKIKLGGFSGEGGKNKVRKKERDGALFILNKIIYVCWCVPGVWDFTHFHNFSQLFIANVMFSFFFFVKSCEMK